MPQRRSSAPECGFAWAGRSCHGRGDHLCRPRSIKARDFFRDVLVHTKGRWAGRPFILEDWQWRDLVRPLLGEVRHDPMYGYVRRFRQCWIELARKNGKSEILAGIALYLLTADGEYGAEVYGAARDREQARVVWDVAQAMVTMSPALRRRIKILHHEKRLVYAETNSFYAILSADALGNLGFNPHCVVFDEVIAQRSDELWNALRTGMGTRAQPLLIAATTAGANNSSFASVEHSEAVKIQEDPQRAPHRLVYVRNTPVDADPWDEENWRHANPALGRFLNIEALREEAKEARNDPTKENAFRQFRLNQWVQATTRWMPLETWDDCRGEVWPRPGWGKPPTGECWVGLDLSARHDLTSAAILTPQPNAPAEVEWRHWLPEEALHGLDEASVGRASLWVRDGWLTLTPGAVIDYEILLDDLADWLRGRTVREVTYDKWSGEYVRQGLQSRLGEIPMVANEPTFTGMTIPMTETMNLVLSKGLVHHGNPIARWCFDAVEVQRSRVNNALIRPVKPVRNTAGARIDSVVALALPIGAWRTRGRQAPQVRHESYSF